MKVAILYGNTVIGHSQLDRLDPSMGVAVGRFEPTDNYLPEMHAGMIDGVRQERSIQLAARSETFGGIQCEYVGIEDYSGTLGEVEATLLGIGYPEYETYFANHPVFLAFKG